MGNHRRGRRRIGRGLRGAVLAGVMLVLGVTVLLVAATRADLTTAQRSAEPAAVAAPASLGASAAGPFEGTWAGPLADPDTTTVDVRLTVGADDRGVVLEVPAAGCTYRGPGPVTGAGDDPGAQVEVRPDRRTGTGGTHCSDSARIRLEGAGTAGPAADRIRYALVSSCDDGVCAPRRAGGELTAWRPGP